MKKIIIFLFVIIALVISGFSLTVSAASFSGGVFGDNYYQFIEVTDPYTGENNAWWTAETAANNSTYNGVKGHLVTITSQAENNFVLSLAPVKTGFAGAWIGGVGSTGDGKYITWITGPESDQTIKTNNFWAYYEPNDGGYAYINIGDGSNVYARGLWVDDSTAGGTLIGVPCPGADPVVGYFVEYENAAAPVPIPGALWLLGSGVTAIIGIRRKGNKKG